MTVVKKVLVLALLGAMGASAGALGGESLFRNEARPEPPPRKICLLFDTSGSMAKVITKESGRVPVTQIEALQDAAIDFVGRQDLTTDSVALVTFATGARVLSPLTHDAEGLGESIRRLRANGTTDMGRGLDVALEVLRGEAGERWILLFSDGKPERSSTFEIPEVAAESAATRAREAGVRMVAIGTGLADRGFLEKITGDPATVIFSGGDALADAFRRSEEVMVNRQMLASLPALADLKESVLRAGIWASLIALGASLGLVAGQNRHLHRRLFGVKEILALLFGCAVTGHAAGAAGQSLFYFLSERPEVDTASRIAAWTEEVRATIRDMGMEVEPASRIAAWTLLGCGVGFGMSFFVPNLSRSRAAFGGIVGGLMAAIAFLEIVPQVGDTSGRLISAGSLGLMTGMTTVLAEAAYKKAWLVVHWAANEKSTVLLGPKPILVGHSRDAHIYPPEEGEPVTEMARISLVRGVIRFEDRRAQTERILHDGDVLTFGKLAVDVRAGEESSKVAAV